MIEAFSLPGDLEPLIGNTLVAKFVFAKDADFTDTNFGQELARGWISLENYWRQEEMPVEEMIRQRELWVKSLMGTLAQSQNRLFAGTFNHNPELGKKILGSLWMAAQEVKPQDLDMLEPYLDDLIRQYLVPVDFDTTREKANIVTGIVTIITLQWGACVASANNHRISTEANGFENKGTSLNGIDLYETPGESDENPSREPPSAFADFINALDFE